MSAFNTIAGVFRGGLKPKPARAYIIPLDPYNEDGEPGSLALGGLTGDAGVAEEQRSFQDFPESISDTKGTNYQTKVIPGLSHPLYQWTSSGAREISFQAVFTRDRSLTREEKQFIRSASTSNISAGKFADDNIGAQSAADSIAGQLSAAGGAGRQALLGLKSFSDGRNVDIPSAIAWLRSFVYPEYTIDGRGGRAPDPDRPLPPRKMILGLPGVRLNWGEPSLNPNEVYCIMLGCDVVYNSFFGDGTPRIARVDLTFAEIIQVGGRVKTQDAFTRRNLGLAGYRVTDKGLT